MMNAIVDLLKQSRIAGVIESLEKSEPVDVKQVLRLQALDIARLGECLSSKF